MPSTETRRKYYEIDEVINHYGIGRFTLRLMILLGIICVAYGAIFNSILTFLALTWSCKYNSRSPVVLWLSTFLGLAFGSLYFGWLADRHGRKLIIAITATICWYFSFLVAISRNYVFLLLTVFFISTGVYGRRIMSNYSSEAFPKQYRPKLQVYLGISGAIGSCIAPLIALDSEITSTMLILVISTPLTVCLLIPLFFSESISYLQITGKQDQLHILLHQISKEHKKTPVKRIKISTKIVKKRGNLSVLFKKKSLLNTMIMISIWVTCQLSLRAAMLLQDEILEKRFTCIGYYPTTNATRTINHCYIPNYIGINHNISAIGSFAELAGLIFCLVTVDLISRKKWIVFGFIATGIGFACLNFCTTRLVHLTLMIVTRSLSAALFQVVTIFTNEVYPTSIRCSATGFLNAISCLVIVLVPVSIELLTTLPPSVLVNIYVSFCILSSCLCPFLEFEPKTNSVI